MPDKKKDPREPKGPAQEAAGSGASSRGRGTADQLGTILSKGLDLAEAGLSLGLKVINRAGAAAVRAATEGGPMAGGYGPPADQFGTEAPPEGPPPPAGHRASPGAGQGPQAQPEYCYVTNRLPLIPGANFKVSFSINNDSMEAAKTVTLRIGDFLGETAGARIEAGDLVVKPTRKTIAPMDFDKFVLQGTVPAGLPPDAYRGQIIVSSGSEFPIPVRLVVMGD